MYSCALPEQFLAQHADELFEGEFEGRVRVGCHDDRGQVTSGAWESATKLKGLDLVAGSVTWAEHHRYSH